MKKVLACLLGILPFVSTPALAYQINLISQENIEDVSSFMETLEKYEISALSKLASALKDSKIDPASVLTIGITQDGTFSEFKYKTTSTDEASKKVILDARSINFGKIPNLKSGTLRFALVYKDLEAKDFKRKLYLIKTPEGQSIGGTGGIGISGITSEGDGKIVIKSLEKKAPVKAVPYSEKDRKFDNDLVSIYTSFKKSRVQDLDFPETNFRTRNIPEEQEKITQSELADKHWLNAAMSLLQETKLARENLERATEKLTKAAELIDKLNPKEKAVFAKTLNKMINHFNPIRGNYAFQEEIAKVAYKTVTSKNFDDRELKIQAITLLAQSNTRTNKKAESITHYKEVLAVALDKISFSKDEAATAYERIAQLQFEVGESEKAKKTIADASQFIEKEFGKNSIRLIPFLALSIKNESNKQKQTTVLAQLEKVIDNYTNKSTDPGGRDSEAASLSRNLNGVFPGIHYRKDDELISEDMQVDIAKLAYKLQLKAHGRLDNSSINLMARTLHSTGRYKQEVEFYKNAIAYAEKSKDRYTIALLNSLRRGYASALESAGDATAAEKVKNDLKFEDDKSAALRQQKLEDSLADLDLRKDSNPLDKAYYRVMLLNNYVTKNDVAKTRETLEKLKQNLEASQEKSRRLMGASSTLASIVRKHSEFLSSDNSIETLFIKDFLLIDERSDESFDSIPMRRLDFMFGRGKESPLSQKLKSALEESRAARGVKPRN